MKLVVATKNRVKLQAAESVFGAQHEVSSAVVPSGVDEQPIGMDEVFTGAQQRALNAWELESCSFGASLSLGIEDGVFRVKALRGEASSSLNFCAVALYDGREFTFASSTAFMLPEDIARCLNEKEMDLSQALNHCDYIDDDEVGTKGGAIAVFTKGRLQRQEYTEQALANLFDLYQLKLSREQD